MAARAVLLALCVALCRAHDVVTDSSGRAAIGFIVENYERLTPLTYFGGENAPESAKEGAFFSFTGRIHMGTLAQSRRQSDKFGPFYELQGWKDFMAKTCSTNKVPEAFNKFYEEHVQMPKPKDDVLYFSESPFAVSRDRIQMRPKAHYAKLLKLITDDACFAKMADLSLYYLIGLPKESPVSTEDMSLALAPSQPRFLMSSGGGSSAFGMVAALIVHATAFLAAMW